MKSEKTAIWLKLAITIIFVIGALIFLYPFIANVVNTQVDKYRIEAFEKATQADEAKQLAKKKQREAELKANPHLGMKLEDELFDEVDKSSALTKKEIKQHLIGSISIPKINSQLPIFDETNSSFLQEGITLLPGTSYPSGGKSTHSVLTGHTGLASKQLFTELKEVDKGDVFYLKVLGKTLAYEVDHIKTVLPDELEDLNVVKDQDYVTLVTCTPYMINTHRLLVRGHRIPVDTQKIALEEKAINRQNKQLLFFYLLLLFLLIGLLIFVIYRQYQHYQSMKRCYKVNFKLLHNGKSPGVLMFKLMDQTKRHPIIIKGIDEIKTNSKGRIRLKNIPGNHYWLIQQGAENPLMVKCWVSRYKNNYFKVKVPKKFKNEWEIQVKKERIN